MPTHRIHLKGPWHYEWITETRTAAEPSEEMSWSGRVAMPASWQSLFGKASGRVRFTRRFGWPKHLERLERVYLVFDGVGGQGKLFLNETILATVSDPAQPECTSYRSSDKCAQKNKKSTTSSTIRSRWPDIDVTRQLQARNVLSIEIAFDPNIRPSSPGGLWAPVAIEIRSQ